MTGIEEELVIKLWDIANLVAGFSAVQTMAFSFFALNQLNQKLRLPELLVEKGIREKLMAGVVIGTIFYIVAIIGCQCLAKSLMPGSNWDKVSGVWYWTTLGRILVVILFGLVTTFAIIYSPGHSATKTDA